MKEKLVFYFKQDTLETSTSTLADKVSTPQILPKENVEFLSLSDWNNAIPVWLPRRYLWGTQAISEFSYTKQQGVKRGIKEKGIKFLEERPLFICALPESLDMSLVIVDGNHRARYSGSITDTLPSLVYTIEQTQRILNRYKDKKRLPLFTHEEEVAEWLRDGIRNCLSTFAPVLPESKLPIVSKSQCMEDLISQFKPFRYIE